MSELLAKFKELCCKYGHKSPSIFSIEFKRIRELEDEILSALKLEELVKKRMRVIEDMDTKWIGISTNKEFHAHKISPIYYELQSLLDEAKK